jgi:hypothetical protein
MSNANSARVAWKVPDWGARYGLGRSKSYAIVRSGKGPRTIVIDGLTRITEEDDAAWRRGLAAQTAEQDKEPAPAPREREVA